MDPGPHGGAHTALAETPKLEIAASQGCERKTKHLYVLLAWKQLRAEPALALGTKKQICSPVLYK